MRSRPLAFPLGPAVISRRNAVPGLQLSSHGGTPIKPSHLLTPYLPTCNAHILPSAFPPIAPYVQQVSRTQGTQRCPSHSMEKSRTWSSYTVRPTCHHFKYTTQGLATPGRILWGKGVCERFEHEQNGLIGSSSLGAVLIGLGGPWPAELGRFMVFRGRRDPLAARNLQFKNEICTRAASQFFSCF